MNVRSMIESNSRHGQCGVFAAVHSKPNDSWAGNCDVLSSGAAAINYVRARASVWVCVCV